MSAQIDLDRVRKAAEKVAEVAQVLANFLYDLERVVRTLVDIVSTEAQEEEQ